METWRRSEESGDACARTLLLSFYLSLGLCSHCARCELLGTALGAACEGSATEPTSTLYLSRIRFS